MNRYTRSMRLCGLLCVFSVSLLGVSETRAFEERTVARGLKESGCVEEPDPVGKTISAIRIWPREIIEEDEPWPQIANKVHTVTRESIVRMELLFDVGDRVDVANLQESERNLRSNLEISLARILVCKADRKGEVRIEVITKDTWSLRPNIDYVFAGGVLQYFALEVVEQNVAGLNVATGMLFRTDLATQRLGGIYQNPRVGTSRVGVNVDGYSVFNKSTGQLEGGYINAVVEQPLFRLSSERGWRVAFRGRKDVFRSWYNSTLRNVPVESGTVAFQYQRNEYDARAQGLWMWGESWKTQLSAGIRAWSRQSTSTSAELQVTYVPLAETVWGPEVRVSGFSPEFVKEQNLDTFGITEDVRLGPRYEVGWVLSPTGFLQGEASVGYTAKTRLGWFWNSIDGRLRLPWNHQMLQVKTKWITHAVGPLRLAVGGRYQRRWNDVTRTFETLGNDNVLRGYPPDYFFGNQVWNLNAEIRTLPWSVMTVESGATAFLDFGNAGLGNWDGAAHPSAGVGLRIGVPQFSRYLFRFDLAWALDGDAGVPVSFVAAFEQVF